ncbi:hypothetical protein A5660_25045 [Mycobacterium alsense]|nr:hypothetical protein A5660_25045 [Mycobacterium alsense]
MAWFEVHTFVAPMLQAVGSWPTAGSPAWCELADDDPVKVAAVLDAGRHHALRVETAQQARAEASRDVSAAADWSAIAHEIHCRDQFYAARPWLRRAAS